MIFLFFFFFFNDTATTEIYTLSLHDALPILSKNPTKCWELRVSDATSARSAVTMRSVRTISRKDCLVSSRSEEHTSELQSRQYLVCRLLLEKKKKKYS